MATVQLRDIVTEADRAAVLALRRAPGQERFLGSMESHFEDAVDDAEGRARGSGPSTTATQLVGFVMISDGIPAETLAADDDIIGPYYLWRLLVDEAYQGRGYGAATIDAVVAYLRTRPGADVLLTSCGQGEGSPQPFYERYGFVATGEIKWDEVVLRLDLTDDQGGRMTTTSIQRPRRAPARSNACGAEPIGWLTTMNPDGQPQSSPIWFLWTERRGPRLLRQARAAQRERRASGRWSRSTSTPTPTGDEVVTMEGEARIDPEDAAADRPTRPTSPSTRACSTSYGWTAEYFAGEYPVDPRITPTRWRVG